MERFDTKIAIAIRADLAVWQKLNVTAFLSAAIAGADHAVIGAPYRDADGRAYLATLVQPVLVFSGDGAALRAAYDRALARGLSLAIYTHEMFATGNDVDNRAAVAAVASEALQLVGIALRAPRRDVDKVVKGLALHP